MPRKRQNVSEYGKPEVVNLEDLTFVEEYQLRVDIPASNPYKQLVAEAIEDAGGEDAGIEWPFDTPVSVIRQKVGRGQKLVVVDGWQRCGAMKANGLTWVMARVRDGNRRDIDSEICKSNEKHGMKRTKADKRHAVEYWYSRYPDHSLRKIAEETLCSRQFVTKVIRQLTGADEEEVSASGQEVEPKRSKKKSDGSSTQAKQDEQELKQFVELDEACPVCGANDWELYDDGSHVCALCQHVHGEAAGVDEEEWMLDDSPVEVIEEKPDGAKVKQVKEQGLDTFAEDHKKAVRSVGQLIRAMKRLGLASQSVEYTTGLLDVLEANKPG